jgi:DNA-directed RNA polymerase specialized sigma24 family protein
MDELDRELSECARSGDRDAVGRLLERIGPRLRSAVLSAGVPPGEAEDAVQEAFARALAHWREARGDETRAGWLAAIARHVAVDWRRRRDRASSMKFSRTTAWAATTTTPAAPRPALRARARSPAWRPTRSRSSSCATATA